MQIASIYEAKTHLSSIIKRVASGEEVIICKAGKPVVRVIQYKSQQSPRMPGAWKGKVKMAEDFDKLPDDLLAAFKGETE